MISLSLHTDYIIFRSIPSSIYAGSANFEILLAVFLTKRGDKSPKLLCGFGIYRRSAEPITQLCRLKVKVTLQGHGMYP